MRVRFTEEALGELRRRRAWWERNRDKAPRLFRDELAALTSRLRDGQFEGAHLYTVHSGHKIWRILMPKTKVHVYYPIEMTLHEVEVITLWNAISGEGPDLSR